MERRHGIAGHREPGRRHVVDPAPTPPRPAGSSPGSSSPSPSDCCCRTTCPGRSCRRSSPSSRSNGRSPTPSSAALTSVVALTVGLLAVPLSLLGDRWGRVERSSSWPSSGAWPPRLRGRGQLRAADAAPASSSASVRPPTAASAWPSCSPSSRPTARASLTGAFMAGGSFGSVLGVALGGVLAVQFGWRWSFGAMAILGLVLVVLYRLLVSDKKLARTASTTSPRASRRPATGARAKLRTPVQHPVGHLRLRRQRPAAVHRRLAVRLAAQLPQPRLRPGAGQGRRRRRDRHPVHGRRHDRLRRGHRPAQPAPSPSASGRRPSSTRWPRWSSSASGSPCTPGGAQLLLLAVGVFFAAGTSGPAGAMVVQPDPRVDPGHRASAP